MAVTSYSELQTAVANWAHRGDLTATQLQEFIALAESDLQVRAKLTQWDAEATVALTNGSGTLPADFAQMKAVRFGTEPTLNYTSPAKLAYLVSATDPATPINYTIIGDTLRVVPTMATGDATVLYVARFVPLSGSAPTNSLLTLFADVYLYGSLVQFAIWSDDDVALQKYGVLFDAGVGRVKRYTYERRYGDAPLSMRLG